MNKVIPIDLNRITSSFMHKKIPGAFWQNDAILGN